MPRVNFGITSDTPGSMNREPWKHASKLEQPRAIPGNYFKKTEIRPFRSPFGVLVSEIDYQLVSSSYRETTLPKEYGEARMIEFHHFVMQPVSVFLILPSSDMATLEEFELPEMRKVIANAVDGLVEKKMNVVLPMSIYKKLEKARMKDKYIARLAERRAALKQMSPVAAQDLPEGKEFRVKGPVLVLIYDHATKFVPCMARVHRLRVNLGAVEDTIKNLKRTDEELVKQKLGHENEDNAERKVRFAQFKNEPEKEVIDREEIVDVDATPSVADGMDAVETEDQQLVEEHEEAESDEAPEEDVVLVKQLASEHAERPAMRAEAPDSEVVAPVVEDEIVPAVETDVMAAVETELLQQCAGPVANEKCSRKPRPVRFQHRPECPKQKAAKLLATAQAQEQNLAAIESSVVDMIESDAAQSVQ